MRRLLTTVAIATLLASTTATEAARPRLRSRPARNLEAGGIVTNAEVTAEAQRHRHDGQAAILGGALIHAAIGTMYMWPSHLLALMPWSLKFFAGAPVMGAGKPWAASDAQLLLPLTLVVQVLAMPLAPAVERRLGTRRTASLGGLLMACALGLASRQCRLVPFAWRYCLCFGLGAGLAYQMPLIVAARCWPASMLGAVSGAVLSGVGVSSLLLGPLLSRAVAPAGVKAVEGVYPQHVYSRWPALLRVLSLACLALSLTGSMLLPDPPSRNAVQPGSTAPAAVSASAAPAKVKGEAAPASLERGTAASRAAPPAAPLPSLLLSPRFTLLWTIALCSAASGLNVAGSFRTFAATRHHLSGGGFLAAAAALATLVGSVGGRVVWGAVYDAVGLRRALMALTLLQGVVMLNYVALSAYRPTFALATMLLLSTMGGNFALLPAHCLKAYGASVGPRVYAALHSALGASAVLGPILGSGLRRAGGFELVYLGLGLLSFVASILASML